MSYLIARIQFTRYTHKSSEPRGFQPGQIVDLKLDAAEIAQLCDDGYCLLADTPEQVTALQFELAHLNFPADQFPEIDLDLCVKPQAPKMPRSRPPALPPVAPIRASELSELGRLLRFSQATKPKQKP